MTRRLHFVYNVDATPVALVSDFLHRIRSPETYPCRLCDITYGRFLKKAEWSRYVAGLSIPSKFYLRSGFARRFPDRAQDSFPGGVSRGGRSAPDAPLRRGAGHGPGPPGSSRSPRETARRRRCGGSVGGTSRPRARPFRTARRPRTSGSGSPRDSPCAGRSALPVGSPAGPPLARRRETPRW